MSNEYPKWAQPHLDHVIRKRDGSPYVLTHECFVDRAGKLTVLVQDEADELVMTSSKGKADEKAA